MTQPVHAVLIGAGNRGAHAYAPYALQHPDQLRFVAVAEPDAVRRGQFAARHAIPPERQFAGWEELLAQPQMGEAALICTPDDRHTAPALAALRGGYHVLLEKPMAATPEECRQLVQASRACERQLHICHVLRYTTHFQTLREIIQSGALGQVVDVDHRENVGYFHMAHSYVRGNWRNRALSSPMILAKCCHDFDILLWLFGVPVERLSSVGGLLHYRAENAPPGAPARCSQGCPAAATCPYEAEFVYLKLIPLWRSLIATGSGLEKGFMQLNLRSPALFRALAGLLPPLRQVSQYRGWPLNVLHPDPSPQNVRRALREGPYGRCVYRCDNDVVDHQVVSMAFGGGSSVTLSMHGHSHVEYRTTRIEGTRGRLTAELGIGGSWVQVDDHRSGRSRRLNTSAGGGAGHGGGDAGLMQAFLSSLRGDGQSARTTAAQALESHLLAFAAETARLEGRVLDASAWAVEA